MRQAMKLFKTRLKTKKSTGFTMVELLFAVANFAFIMMIAISAFIAVMQVYNKASFARRTQQTARTVLDQIAKDSFGSSIMNTKDGWCKLNLEVNCICFITDNKAIAYYQAYGDSTNGPSISPVDGAKNNYRIWRSVVNDLPDGINTCDNTDDNHGLIRDWLINGGNWKRSGVETAALTPEDVNVDHLILLPDSATEASYVMTMMGLVKGTSSAANDPFYDVFNIQSVSSTIN